MALQTFKRLFTVSEYEQMTQAGIFADDDRVELIDGEIFEMAPIGSRHAACVRRLRLLLSQQLGDRALVDTQNPVYLHDRSEPQPDVVLLRHRADLYVAGHPRPSDVFLVIEVADTSLPYDRDIKVPAYARSGIPEVWVVDLTSMSVFVYRMPSPQGYRDRQHVRSGQTITPQAFPELDLPVDSILQ